MFDTILLFIWIFLSTITIVLGIVVIIKSSRKTRRRRRKVELKAEPSVEASEKSGLAGLLQIAKKLQGTDETTTLPEASDYDDKN